MSAWPAFGRPAHRARSSGSLHRRESAGSPRAPASRIGRRFSGRPAACHMSVRFSMAPRRRMGRALVAEDADGGHGDLQHGFRPCSRDRYGRLGSCRDGLEEERWAGVRPGRLRGSCRAGADRRSDAGPPPGRLRWGQPERRGAGPLGAGAAHGGPGVIAGQPWCPARADARAGAASCAAGRRLAPDDPGGAGKPRHRHRRATAGRGGFAEAAGAVPDARCRAPAAPGRAPRSSAAVG